MSDEIEFVNGSEEFIGKTSKRVLTYGNAISLFTVAFLLIFGFFVSFDQTITAEALITSNPPPATLLARTNGTIRSINITSGDHVERGEILAVLKSPGDFRDIIYLDSTLNIDNSTDLTVDGLLDFYPTDLKLGPSIQTAYTTFVESYLSHILLQSLEIEQGNIESLQERKSSTYNQIAAKRQQLRNSMDKLTTGAKNLKKYRELYEKGVFSENEMDIKKREYLDLLSQKNKDQEELESLRISLSDISNRAKSSQSHLTRNSVMSLSTLQLHRQSLISEIENWKEQYLFISPIDGKISTYDSWSTNQEVEDGENIFTIVPMENNHIFAKCKVPVQNTGELEKGQKVLIHIESYPFSQWGALEGRVKSLSDVPKSETIPYYLVDVSINGLTTTFGKELQFKQNMNGQAYILLNELSLFERIMFNLRKNIQS